MSETVVADTDACLNCGQPLTGSFCANCGQESRELRRPFLLLMNNAIFAIFELDGRAYKTLFYLFTKPGYLCSEYFDGRRVSYTPPLRLFLVISISFFLLMSIINAILSIDYAIGEQSALTEDATANVITIQNVERTQGDTDSTDNKDGLAEIFNFIESIRIPFLSEPANQNLQGVMRTQAESNFNELIEDPRGYLAGSLEYITVFMLLMMPILALIQKILYFTSRRYYIEHLILTMHNHAFLVLAIFLSMVVNLIEDWELFLLSTMFGYLGTALSLWIIIYLFLSLKRYFKQGYLITFLKFITTTVLYSISLSFGVFVFAALFFFLL